MRGVLCVCVYVRGHDESALCEGREGHTSSREEEISKLMKGDRHDSVCEVECLLYSVAMVNINVYI